MGDVFFFYTLNSCEVNASEKGFLDGPLRIEGRRQTHSLYVWRSSNYYLFFKT